MSQVVEHQNTASHGPVGMEYLLPTDSGQFDGWLTQFLNTSPSDIASAVAESWSSPIPCVQAIATALRSYIPRSLYHLPCEWSSTVDWLLFENEHHVMYIPPPSKLVSGDELPKELLDLVRCFDGYQYGYNPHPDDDFLRCDSGFQKLCDLKRIETTDDEYLWEYGETVLGGYWFFTTSCGNRLYLRQDGTISKRNHENSEIDDAFGSLDDFAVSFIEQYVHGQSNEQSPLYY